MGWTKNSRDDGGLREPILEEDRVRLRWWVEGDARDLTWVAYYIATGAQESAAPARAASSGTRKVPQTGVQRTCPV